MVVCAKVVEWVAAGSHNCHTICGERAWVEYHTVSRHECCCSCCCDVVVVVDESEHDALQGDPIAEP